ncbi:MAG: phosphoribosyltransferase [Sphingobacteriia bacterium]
MSPSEPSPPYPAEAGSPAASPALYRLNGHTFRLLLSHTQLQARIQVLAGMLNLHYAGATADAPVLLVPVLNGAFRFAGALMPYLQFPYLLHPVKISTYGGAQQAQRSPHFQLGPPFPPSAQILILEDIVDRGHTLHFLRQQLAGIGPIRVASLLYKPTCHAYAQPPEYVGFEIEPAFVVGYGLDYDEQGRHLNGVYQRT